VVLVHTLDGLANVASEVERGAVLFLHHRLAELLRVLGEVDNDGAFRVLAHLLVPHDLRGQVHALVLDLRLSAVVVVPDVEAGVRRLVLFDR
jgi:hypothetical protein